jgi:hypothetical protein
MKSGLFRTIAYPWPIEIKNAPDAHVCGSVMNLERAALSSALDGEPCFGANRRTNIDSIRCLDLCRVSGAAVMLTWKCGEAMRVSTYAHPELHEYILLIAAYLGSASDKDQMAAYSPFPPGHTAQRSADPLNRRPLYRFALISAWSTTSDL